MDALIPLIPEAIRYFKRHYFNVSRREIYNRIDALPNLLRVMEIETEFTMLGYSRTAIDRVHTRGLQLLNLDPNYVFPDLSKCVFLLASSPVRLSNFDWTYSHSFIGSVTV